MPSYNKFNDVETTYELKTYEISLKCGKCGPGQLIASDRKNEDGETIHVCDNCGREEAIAGLGYPRTEKRKVEPVQRFIERMEAIIDPNERTPEYYVKQGEVAQLPWQAQLNLLQTTTEVEMVDHLKFATLGFLHRLDAIRCELFDMAREAAAIRAETMPVDEADKLFEPHEIYHPSLADLGRILSTTRHPENVTHIQNSREGGILHFPEISNPLYDIARQIVALRNSRLPQQVSRLRPKTKEAGPERTRYLFLHKG